ncbi:JmjC domain-containing protein 7 [Tanacetum coccineum]
MNSKLERLWEGVRELSLGTTQQIDRLHTPPTPLQFLRDYFSQNKPFILSASAATTLNWPATTLWTSTSYLLNALSSSNVSLHLTPTGQADSLTPHPSDPDTLCFASAHVQQTSFSSAIDAIKSSYKEGTSKGFVAYAQQQNIFIQGSIGATSFHKDHYENLYAVVTGEKHFVLLPPTDVHRMYIREYPAAQYNYSEETGPSMWFHHVRQTPDNRGLTIAGIDMQFDTNIILQLLAIKYCTPGINIS